MREASGIPVTLAVSAVVHGLAFGVAHTWFAGSPAPPRAPDPPVVLELVPPVATPAIVPTEVVLFTEPSGAPAASPAPEVRRSPPARALVAVTTPSEAARGTEPASTERNRYFDMRRPGTGSDHTRVDLALPEGRWDDLEHAPAGTKPARDVATGQLAPAGGGTHKSDQGPFTAKVDKDGGVTFKDKRNFNIHLALPSPKDIGDLVQAWYYDPNKPVGFLPPSTITKPPRLVREDVDVESRVTGDEKAVYGEDRGPKPGDGGGGAGIPIAGGGFDITDAFMRSRGQDPYASKKLRFLDSTRDERVQIGAKYKTQQLAQVAKLMKKNLDRTWAMTEHDPAARKRALFELWDECVETGSAEMVAAGMSARAMVIGFIRTRLPAGSAGAFTRTEIAALSRNQQSKAVFAPYE